MLSRCQENPDIELMFDLAKTKKEFIACKKIKIWRIRFWPPIFFFIIFYLFSLKVLYFDLKVYIIHILFPKFEKSLKKKQMKKKGMCYNIKDLAQFNCENTLYSVVFLWLK